MASELSVTLSLFFGLGVVVRSLLLLDGPGLRKNLPGIAISLISIPLTLLIGIAKIPDLSLFTHIFISFAAYCMTFAIAMRKTILPMVNEKSILVLSLALWYAFFEYRSLMPEPLIPLLLAVFVPMTAGTLILAFADFVPGFWLTLAFYVWYLLVIIFIGLVQFPFWNLSFFFGKTVWEPLAAVDVFLSGALFSYLAIHATYVLALFPLPSRRQSFAHRFEEVREHAEMLVDRYSDHQLKVAETMLILLLAGGLYGLNYAVGFIPSSTLINLTVLLSPLLTGLIGRALERASS